MMKVHRHWSFFYCNGVCRETCIAQTCDFLYMCLRFTLQETLLKDTLSYCSSSTCFIIIHLSFLRRKFEFVFEILSRSTLFCHVFPCKWYRLSGETYYNLFPPCFICKLSLLHGSISKFKTQSFKFLQTTTDGFNMF